MWSALSGWLSRIAHKGCLLPCPPVPSLAVSCGSHSAPQAGPVAGVLNVQRTHSEPCHSDHSPYLANSAEHEREGPPRPDRLPCVWQERRRGEVGGKAGGGVAPKWRPSSQRRRWSVWCVEGRLEEGAAPRRLSHTIPPDSGYHAVAAAPLVRPSSRGSNVRPVDRPRCVLPNRCEHVESTRGRAAF